MTLLLPVVCLFACALSLGFESRNQTALASKTKFLASLAFVGFAWDMGAMNSTYGQWVFIGLLMSLMGDVLLTLKGHKHAFISGLLFFMLAHLFYAWAFFKTGFNGSKLPMTLPTVILAVTITALWLRPHLTGLYAFAIPVYLFVIAVMLIFAWSNLSVTAWWWIVTGATLFAMSDLLVARNRFIQANSIHRIIGLPKYYLAQLMLAYSINLIP
ncbi:lysoplasmalogenase [Marinicella litoralis]|uniref:Putative membrane protein YhhN n=1 Tax=Marinicella litoralis TaxID=644220 RepID=A0A4R6XW21_9GAMM|nr:lysoplasmalogenase [Marinicella litoralis]TDR22630.1 putative membrane protein YhhN [Marinicella litoralis]